MGLIIQARNNFKLPKNAEFAIAFIAIGVSIALLALLLFTSDITTTLVFGFLVGVSFTYLISLVVNKFLLLNKYNNKKNPEIFHAIGNRLFSEFNIEASDSDKINSGKRISIAIKAFISSWSLFSAIALILSVALYYATLFP